MTLIKTCDGCHKTKKEVGDIEDVFYDNELCDSVDLCRACTIEALNYVRRKNNLPEIGKLKELDPDAGD